MSKGKNFREWIEDDYIRETREQSGNKKDSKRYDDKKSEIQKARREKRNHKESFYK
jgi:hypothetical protein